jgi:hypothetical protein
MSVELFTFVANFITKLKQKTMRKLLLMACAVALLTACEKQIVNEDDAAAPGTTTLPDGTVAKAKKFTFTMKGDFTSDWKDVNKAPRRVNEYLSAEGKDMTDVWVLDYMNGQLVQQVHQSDNTAEDFGMPVMQLAYGSHHVYFVASRGAGADLNVGEHRLTWEKVSDTFYKDYEVNVVATSNGNRAVTLERVVTKLRLTFTDVVPENAATINITPATWYKGLDYVTGEPCAVAESQTTTINIPSASIGQTGVSASMFSVSTATEWTTDVTISSKTSTDAVLGTATLTDVPLKANRVSDYRGPLFSAGGSLSLSLNGEWMDSYNGTW